jgi:hypothetical protein
MIPGILDVSWLVRLSAYLANVTRNTTYLDSATRSGAFLLNVMGITRSGNGIAALNASSKAVCDKETFGGKYHQVAAVGIFMEGLAYLPPNVQLGSTPVNQLWVPASTIPSALRLTYPCIY